MFQGPMGYNNEGTKLYVSGTGAIYWDPQWDIPLGWVS